jgi:hypothetical protein
MDIAYKSITYEWTLCFVRTYKKELMRNARLDATLRNWFRFLYGRTKIRRDAALGLVLGADLGTGFDGHKKRQTHTVPACRSEGLVDVFFYRITC